MENPREAAVAFDTGQLDKPTTGTQPRTIDGVTLSGKEINRLYDLFRRLHARYLPIPGLVVNPDITYDRCQFLFWAIIICASRTFSQNPTTFPGLTRSLSRLAATSILEPWDTWDIVHSLLIVINWCLLEKTQARDLVFTLTGTLLHIVKQSGSLGPATSVERGPRKRHRDDQPVGYDPAVLRRSTLWAYTVSTYQHMFIVKGLSAHGILEISHADNDPRSLWGIVPHDILLELSAQELVTQCSTSVESLGVCRLTVEGEHELSRLLLTWEQRAHGLRAKAYEAAYITIQMSMELPHYIKVLQHFHAATACLSVLGMHCFREHTLYLDDRCLKKLEVTACEVINLVQDLCVCLCPLAVAPTKVVAFALYLAGSILLRLIKGPPMPILDIPKANMQLARAVALATQMVVTDKGLENIVRTVLSDLQYSTKAFRAPDGSPAMKSRFPNRLVSAPILDAWYWWDEEFGHSSRSRLTMF
ncbi:hypothetical protein BJX61DRAFT_236837 [Aspergillus egyptiacus]|nr:hypothetical protein BJX61DRAFT_236837 [Aspergillus egyptiacus]